MWCARHLGPLPDPGTIKFGKPPDEEILVQFVNALTTEPFAVGVLGPVVRRYAYGVSQTAAALLETLHAPGGPGLFDLTLLHVAMWPPPFATGEFERIEGEFAPLSIDPVYGFPTGIARDGDLNALGGVRLPDLHVGRAQYIAFDASVPGFPINGTSIDLSCAPPAGSGGSQPRFANHGQYVSPFITQANRLLAAGFLLSQDADALKDAASASNVGKPGSC